MKKRQLNKKLYYVHLNAAKYMGKHLVLHTGHNSLITAVLRRFDLHMCIDNYTFSTAGMNKLKKKNCYLKCIVCDKLLKPRQSFRITLYIRNILMWPRAAGLRPVI